MKHYFAVVHKDADSAFGVTFPDLPGCFSAADDLEDVTANASEALDLFFEDAAPVMPMPIEDARRIAAEDLAAGAFLVAVPLLSRDTTSTRVNISLERGVLADIDTAAAARRLTRSGFIAQAARNGPFDAALLFQ